MALGPELPTLRQPDHACFAQRKRACAGLLPVQLAFVVAVA
jgi:hypothetical protein